MCHARSQPRSRGFTLIEVLVTLSLVGLIALVSMPLYEVTSKRMKEAQLRQALRVIRSGLDTYKAAVDAGSLTKAAGESGYPATLDLLTEPLELANQPGSLGESSRPAQRLLILRQLPRDPFFADPQAPAAQTWNTRTYGTRPDDPQPGADVFDVSSRSAQAGLDGTLYNTW